MAESNRPNKSSRRRRWLTLTLEALLIISIFFGIRLYQQRGMVHGAAPPLQGILLDGRPASLSALRGQAVLVQFWATWCPVCAAEQSSIAAISRDYPVLTVAMQSEGAKQIAAYLSKKGVSYPVINDPEGRLSSRWGVKAVPASFIIDPQGKIRFREVGYTTETGLRLRLWLANRH